MNDHVLTQDTAFRLMRYSAAASLGAFAFGQAATETMAEVAYTDLGGIVIERGEYAEVDVDGDGYLDFRMVNTEAGGIGGYGTMQFNTSIDAAWYGPPQTGINPASYLQIDMEADATHGTNAYYCRSFIDTHVVGPSNPYCWDETGTSGGRLYGLLSQYPGWDQNSFWNPSPNPVSYGYSYNEFAGLRMVDINGDQRWGWVRFQVVIHDAANENNFPIPDGKLTRHDFFWDTDRYMILYDFAFETEVNVDIIAKLLGDLNEDAYVGLDDLDIILQDWNHGDPSPPNDPIVDPRADANGDGFVGLDDLDMVLTTWNKGAPPVELPTPEPGALGLLAAGIGALSLRRNKR